MVKVVIRYIDLLETVWLDCVPTCQEYLILLKYYQIGIYNEKMDI